MQPLDELSCVRVLLIERQAHAQTKLGVVLKKRVAPRGTSALAVHRVRSRRQVCAVDARAPGRVCDDRTVAVELRHQLDVRRLAATRAGA